MCVIADFYDGAAKKTEGVSFELLPENFTGVSRISERPSAIYQQEMSSSFTMFIASFFIRTSVVGITYSI